MWQTFTGTVHTHHSCVQGTGTGRGCTGWGYDGHKVGQTTTCMRASHGSSFKYHAVGGWAHCESKRPHGLTTRHAQVTCGLLPIGIPRAASSRHVKLKDNGTVTSIQLQVER